MYVFQMMTYYMTVCANTQIGFVPCFIQIIFMKKAVPVNGAAGIKWE